MSKQLDELLFTIRQHPAFEEMKRAVAPPEMRWFKESEDPQQQWAQHIFRSGRRMQHASWLQFLIGEPPQQEK